MNNSAKFGKINKAFGRSGTAAIIVIALLAVAAGLYVQHAQQSSPELPSLKKTIILPNSKAIQSVEFTDHTGKPFTHQQLQGQWSIIFFGFTHCPDICPTTMHTLKQVKTDLSAAGHADFYQVLMVTVDPQRDTVERLANYVPYFDPSFIGLTSSLEITTEFARQLGILFVAHEADGNGNYDVDHGTALILINPQGEMAGVISAPHKRAEISEDLIALANHFGDRDLNSEKQTQTPAKAANEKALVEEESNSLQFSNAWIRPAPPTATNMAGYFDLHNSSNQDITLVAVASDQFDMVMLHETRTSEGTAEMHHLDEITIPANSTIHFKPMGLHLMLMDADYLPKIGDPVSLEFTDTNGGTYQQTIEVRQDPSAD